MTLLFMSIWLVAAAPLGADGEAAKLGLLFSAISGMYGLLWLGAAVVQARGWDMRPIGNLKLLPGFDGDTSGLWLLSRRRRS